MNTKTRISVVALAVAAGWALPAQAQAVDATAIQRELATMRAEMQAMAQRMTTLEAELSAARAAAGAATSAAAAATAAAAAIPAASVTAKPATAITWDGAPKLSAAVDPKNPDAGTWSFKPRGRLQVDVAGVDAPDAIGTTSLGIGTEFRRAYIGFDGTIPGGFGYRAEIDVANSSVQIADLYLTYKPKPELTLTLGHQKPAFSLEEVTSDLFTSFLERASFTSAFGFERRLGLSAAYAGKSVVVQAGVFADDAAALNADTNNSYGVNGRVVFMPKIGSGTLHVGGSAQYREFNDLGTTARYSVRPFAHTTDLRLIDTRAFSAKAERGLGAELGYVNGRFHATAESYWMTAIRPGAVTDPTFNGGYAELGYLLTRDTTAYRGGAYDRIRPARPLGSGGMGALQVNVRYDWLDLNDGAIVGGRQQVAGASLLWIPTDYVRFILNYGHIWIDDAAVAAGAARDYTADALGLRAQFDF